MLLPVTIPGAQKVLMSTKTDIEDRFTQPDKPEPKNTLKLGCTYLKTCRDDYTLIYKIPNFKRISLCCAYRVIEPGFCKFTDPLLGFTKTFSLRRKTSRLTHCYWQIQPLSRPRQGDLRQRRETISFTHTRMGEKNML